MKTLEALLMIPLALLSSCVPLRQRPPQLPPEIIYQQVYRLRDDKERFEALQRFYERSCSLDVAMDDAPFYTVLVKAYIPSKDKVNASISHGYLLDDCGLVLTCYHHVRDTSSSRFVTRTIIDVDGMEYGAYVTDFIDPDADAAILIANTRKLPLTHPLKFPDETIFSSHSLAYFIPFDFFSSPTAKCSFPFSDYQQPLISNGINQGIVLSLEDYLHEVSLNGNVECSSAESSPSLRDKLSPLSQRFYLSSMVQFGDSGSLVFGDDHTFLGMVWGYSIYDNETSGLGIATKSTAFLRSLEDYLQQNDVCEGLAAVSDGR